MNYSRLSKFLKFFAILVLAVATESLTCTTSVHAQIGGTIGYGSSIFGTLTSPGQSLTYSFSGTTDDFVRITMNNWTGTLDPQLELIAPDGVTPFSSANNPFSDDPLEAFISLFLPQTGTYSVRVRGEHDTFGDFVLKVQGQSRPAARDLVYGEPVVASIPVDAQPQFFAFEAQTCPTVLTVTNLSDGLPFTFPFLVRVYAQQGTQIGHLYGGDAVEDRLVVAASSGRYTISVLANDPAVSGSVEFLVSCVDQAPPCIASAPAGTAGVVPCRPCFADDFNGDACDAWMIEVTRSGTTATFTWPPFEGAEWYIFSVIDASGRLLDDSPQLIEEGTTHIYSFNAADLPSGPFTAVVCAGVEDDDPDYLCVGSVEVSFEGDTTASCAGILVGADIVPGAARAAVVHWDAVPGTSAYLLHVYALAEDGGLIGIRVFTVDGDAATYHLADVFPAEYDRFQVRVAAYEEATGGGAFGDMPQGYICDGVIDFAFEPLGPVHWGPAV